MRNPTANRQVPDPEVRARIRQQIDADACRTSAVALCKPRDTLPVPAQPSPSLRLPPLHARLVTPRAQISVQEARLTITEMAHLPSWNVAPNPWKGCSGPTRGAPPTCRGPLQHDPSSESRKKPRTCWQQTNDGLRSPTWRDASRMCWLDRGFIIPMAACGADKREPFTCRPAAAISSSVARAPSPR